MDAYDEFEAVDRIKATCRIVTSIVEVESALDRPRHIFGGPKITSKSLAFVSSQFFIILKAGLPIVRSVELIANQTEDKALKKLLGQVAQDVSAGHSLAASFESKGKALPTTFVETIRAGEESGTLEQSFGKLQTYYEAEHKTNSKVKSAMMYPAFLAVLAVIVIAVVMVVTIPTFSAMFQDLGAEMPLPTQILINVADFMASSWHLLLGILVALILSMKLYSNTENGRVAIATLQLKLPALGQVARMKGASQFANTLSTLISAGLPLIRAVAVTAKVLDNYSLRLQLGSVLGHMAEGQRLAHCLADLNCFPELLVEMTAVGEDTGSLEETLSTIGEFYDEEVSVASQRALSMLQPIITVVMGAVIGFVVIALYLPMFTMYGSM